MLEHFDVAVIGNQLSGIIAAALLAKRGRRVLLIDNGESLQPQTFFPLPGLDEAPHMRWIHDELALDQQVRQLMSHLNSCAYQVVLPEHRLSLSTHRPALIDELIRAFPHLQHQIATFVENLFRLDQEINLLHAQASLMQFDSWYKRFFHRKFWESLKPYTQPFSEHPLFCNIAQEKSLCDALLIPLSFIQNIGHSTPSTWQAVRLLARYLRGTYKHDMGLASVADMMLKAAQKAGAVIQRRSTVRDLQISGRKFTQLHTNVANVVYCADYFICNTAQPLRALLPPTKKPAKAVAQDLPTSARGGWLTLNLEVDEAVIPRGMAEIVFVQESSKEDFPMLVQQRSLANQQHLLSATCPVSVSVWQAEPMVWQELQQQILQQLGQLVPFLPDFTHSITTYPNLSKPIKEPTYPRFELNHLPDIDHMGIAVRSLRGYFKNTVRCGLDVIPGLGVEGSYIVAWEAVRELYQMAGSAWKNPLTKPFKPL